MRIRRIVIESFDIPAQLLYRLFDRKRTIKKSKGYAKILTYLLVLAYLYFDQLTFGTSCGMTEPAEPSLHEQCRNACKGEAASQFHGWRTVSAPYA